MTPLRALRRVLPLGAALAAVLGVRTPSAQADGGQPLATCVEWDCTGSICNRRLMSCTCYASAQEASQHTTGQYGAYGSATQMQSKLVTRCADDGEGGWNLCCTAGNGGVLCSCETYQSSVSCDDVAQGRGALVSTCEGARAAAAAPPPAAVAPPRPPDVPQPPTESAEQRRRREARERADEAARTEAERRARQAREQQLAAFFKLGGKLPSGPLGARIGALRNACLAGSSAACALLPRALAGKLPPNSSIPQPTDACTRWHGEYDVFDYMAHSLGWNHDVIESIAEDDGWPAAQTQIANGVSDPSVNAWQQHKTDYDAFAQWATQVLASCDGLLAACGGIPAAIDVGPMSAACSGGTEQACFAAIAAQITNAEHLDKFAVCAQGWVTDYRSR